MNNNWKFIFKRKICKSDEGVVGIVVAVLLIGLLVTFISIIQMQYVPEWMKENEAKHMDEVANQFADLKFAIDTLTVFKDENTLITNSVTLGSSELPFFVSTRGNGQLDIIDNSCTVTISGKNSSVSITKTWPDMGIIKYSSVNGYLENQNFIYECGGIITSQSEGNFISIDPSFKPSVNRSTNEFNISFKIVDIVGKGGKISEAGYDTTTIRTAFNSNRSGNFSEVNSITIKTNYNNSWYEFFRSSLKGEGLTENSDFRVYYTNAGEVKVEFIGSGSEGLPFLTYEEFKIEAQIGAGIVK